MLIKIKLSFEDWLKEKEKRFSKINTQRSLLVCPSCYKLSYSKRLLLGAQKEPQNKGRFNFVTCENCLHKQTAVYDIIEAGSFNN